MIQSLRKFAFDRTTWICSLACSATFWFWAHQVNPHLGIADAVFCLAMPIGCLYLGHAALRWMRYPIRAAHSFPIAFLSGSTVAMLLLFVIHLFPLSLKMADVVVLLLGIIAFATAPQPQRGQPAQFPSWLALCAVVLILCAASLWTQDVQPYWTQQGEHIVVTPWSDFFYHAQFTGQLRADTSIVRLGDPNLSGRPVAFYHYASYMLSASVEAWSGHLTAMDCTAAAWIPLAFMVMGLGAYVIASEWWGDLAGIAAVAAVLLIPDAPTYGIPLDLYSFHWLIAVSAGLGYGIAGAALALVLITAAVQSDRMWMLACGFCLMFATVLLKAHVTIVAMPLAIAWVFIFKRGWSVRQKWLLAAVVVIGAVLALVALERLQIGPSILPLKHRPGGFGFISTQAEQIPPGTWHRLIVPHLHGRNVVHLAIEVLIAVGAPLGGWLLLFALLFVVNSNRRRLDRLDWIPVFALVIYVGCLGFFPPNQRGTIDELWHRPFVWLYFVIAVWCLGKIGQSIQKRLTGVPSRAAAIIAVIAALLLIFPYEKGKSIQHTRRMESRYMDMPIDRGLVDCANFVREHSPDTDIVQDQTSEMFPILSALSERRSYLGLSPDYWRQFNHASVLLAESLRRKKIVEGIPRATSDQELKKIVTATGIRWYIARPKEVLSWPGQRAEKPAFTAHGYRLYDLKSAAK